MAALLLGDPVGEEPRVGEASPVDSVSAAGCMRKALGPLRESRLGLSKLLAGRIDPRCRPSLQSAASAVSD